MTRSDWSRYSQTTRDRAVAWHVRLTSGEATDDDFSAFSDWLAADQEHEPAYAAVERSFARPEYSCEVASEHPDTHVNGETVVTPPARRPRSILPRLVWVTAAAALVAVGAYWAVALWPDAPWK